MPHTTPTIRLHLAGRALVALLLLCLPWCGHAQNSKRIKQMKQESTALKKQIAESENLLKNAKKDIKSQLKNLSVIDGQIVDQTKIVGDYQNEVETLGKDLTAKEAELKKLEQELTACKQKYRRAVLYLNRKRLLQNKWMFVLSAKNFRQMYRRMRYASDYSKYLRAQAETIKQKEEAVSKAREAVHTAKKEKDLLLTEAQGEHKRLEQKKKERQGVISELNKKQSQLTTTIAQQKRKYANLNASIDRLIKQEIAAAEARRKKEEARRKAAEEKRRKAEEAEARRKKNAKTTKTTTSKKTSTATPTKSKPRYEEEDATDRTLSSGFAANRGRLPIPITGSYAVTGRYGQYSVEGLSGVSLDSKGINLTGRSGAQARCVYDGEVSAVANVGGTYVVIVRHGSYYSVYSNLSSVAVRNGQAVKTRQTLGAVAGDGSGGCTLHFQLRKRSGSTAGHINPLPWLAR